MGNKMKTHKGLSKRMKVTARGKVKHRRPGASHLLSVKSGIRKQHLRRSQTVSSSVMAKKFKIKMGEA